MFLCKVCVFAGSALCVANRGQETERLSIAGYSGRIYKYLQVSHGAALRHSSMFTCAVWLNVPVCGVRATFWWLTREFRKTRTYISCASARFENHRIDTHICLAFLTVKYVGLGILVYVEIAGTYGIPELRCSRFRAGSKIVCAYVFFTCSAT